jgi:hypothetical protein
MNEYEEYSKYIALRNSIEQLDDTIDSHAKLKHEPIKI